MDARTTAERLVQEHDDQRRVERQRTLVNALPDCKATDKLKEAMIARARWLLERGLYLEAAVLLEFLPSRDADQVLREVAGAAA